MKIKSILSSMVVLMSTTVAVAFVAPDFSENYITIESIDGNEIGLKLAPCQIKGLGNILPGQYFDMLTDSYGRFRQQSLASDSFSVDGIDCLRTTGDNGEVYVLSGNFEFFGNHTISVNVGTREDFITLMDTILSKQ